MKLSVPVFSGSTDQATAGLVPSITSHAMSPTILFMPSLHVFCGIAPGVGGTGLPMSLLVSIAMPGVHSQEPDCGEGSETGTGQERRSGSDGAPQNASQHAGEQ